MGTMIGWWAVLSGCAVSDPPSLDGPTCAGCDTGDTGDTGASGSGGGCDDPLAVEVPGDGVDNDCDGLFDCLDPDLAEEGSRSREGDATGPEILELCRGGACRSW